MAISSLADVAGTAPASGSTEPCSALVVVWRWMRPAGSTLFLAAAASGLFFYPYARGELGLGLLCYCAAVLWRPALALLLLPLLLTLLNLAPWSGSLYLEEYDLFVFATIGVLLARRMYALNLPLSRVQQILLLLLMLSHGLSLCRGLLQVPSFDTIALLTYDSPINALRGGKGFFWALLLLPGIAALWQRNREQAVACLLWGGALGAFSLGVVAVWERGVLQALAESGSPHAALGALLDFTTRYRITGLFSEMHVGGEYIDGYVALMWPFGILIALHARRTFARTIGIAAHLCILYAAVATFSRATYFALGLGAAALGLHLLRAWILRAASLGRSAELTIIVLNAMALLVLPAIFMRGGTVSLSVGLAAWAGSVSLGHVSKGRERGSALGCALVGILAAWSLTYAMSTSKWVENVFSYSLTVSLAVAALLAVTGARLGRRLSDTVDGRTLATVLVLVAGSFAIVTPAVLGYRMETRFGASARDTPVRWQHWQVATGLMRHDLTTALFGMGLGQFPHEFTKAHSSAKEGSYNFGTQNGNRYLTLIEGEHFRFTQRVHLPANTDHTLALSLRSVSDSYALRLRLCRRNIIADRENDPRCAVYRQELQDTGGRWLRLEWRFNTGSLGDNGIFGRQPLTLEITNLSDCNRRFRPTSVLDVDDVMLTSEAGRNAVRNGDFEAGQEGWFPHSDWSHMRWHVKNTWVNIYFDQGLLGLAAFGGFALVLVAGAMRRAKCENDWSRNTLASVGMISLISFLALSPLGSPLDAPRVALIAYVLMFALAVDLGARDRGRLWPEPK